MSNKQLILAINPGSTSTKVAVYDGETQLFVKNIKHSAEEIAKYARIADQYEFRKSLILEEIATAGYDLNEFKVIVGRGGLVKPISSGVWGVNAAMIEDLKNLDKK
jgi:butyrate kinase